MCTLRALDSLQTGLRWNFQKVTVESLLQLGNLHEFHV